MGLRSPGATWLDVTYTGLDERIGLLSVDVRIGLAELYCRIEPRKARGRER